MDKLQIENKLDTLLEQTKQNLKDEAMLLLNSGGVDTAQYSDNYLLPKILLTVALENEVDKVSPPKSMKQEWKDIRNLRHF